MHRTTNFHQRLARRAALITILLVVGLGSVCAQNSSQHLIDSLIRKLPLQQEDTTKVRLLVTIAQKYNRVNFDSAKTYANKAKELALDIGDEKGRAMAVTELGMSYYNEEIYEPALDMYFAALDIFISLGDQFNIAHSYNNIANVHSSNGDLALAIENFEKSQKIFLDNGFKEQAIYPAHNLASVYSDLNQNQKALDIYFNNLKIIKEENLTNKRLKAATLNNIGNTYRDMGECEKALPYLRESEAIKLEMNDKVGLGNSWNNIGCCLIRSGKLDQGEEYIRKALQLGVEIERLTIQEESYGFLSELAEKRGDYKLALQMAQKSYEIQDSIEIRNQKDRIAGMQRAYEQNELDRAIIEKEKMQDHERMLMKENSFRTKIAVALVAAMALLIVLIIVLLLAFTARSRSSKVLQEKSAQIEEQSAQLQQTNEELRTKNDRLEDLMREKDGLIGIVAHDLKAPLARSAGLSNLIALSGPLNDEQRSYLRMIEKVTDQGQLLIRDLLDLNAIEHQESRIQHTTINLTELVTETVASYEAEWTKKNISVETLASQSHTEIRSDRSYLTRILDNLISNAIKFSPKGSKISISIRMEDGHAKVSVTDQGPGFTQEDRSKLFKKFQRLSARPTGGESSTGLGLAITKALVDKLQGGIDLISEPGKGASFVVRLPRELNHPS